MLKPNWSAISKIDVFNAQQEYASRKRDWFVRSFVRLSISQIKNVGHYVILLWFWQMFCAYVRPLILIYNHNKHMAALNQVLFHYSLIFFLALSLSLNISKNVQLFTISISNKFPLMEIPNGKGVFFLHFDIFRVCAIKCFYHHQSSMDSSMFAVNNPGALQFSVGHMQTKMWREKYTNGSRATTTTKHAFTYKHVVIKRKWIMTCVSNVLSPMNSSYDIISASSNSFFFTWWYFFHLCQSGFSHFRMANL